MHDNPALSPEKSTFTEGRWLIQERYQAVENADKRDKVFGGL